METMMTSAKGKRRAVGVVRVSRVGDREGESFHSPDIQRDGIAKLCQRKGWHLIDTYEELNVSGGAQLEDRPGLSRAVVAIQTGRADTVIAYDANRLWRSNEVRTTVLRLVEDSGGEVWTLDGRVTNGRATHKFTGTVTTAADEMYKDLIREKAGEAQLEAIGQGVPPIMLPPGLRRATVEGKNGPVKKGPVELHPEQAPVVAEAVRMRADGATVREVRDHLAANGIDRSYHGTSSLLKSRLLIGEIVFGENRKRPEDVWHGECPAVVDRPTWERAQRMSAPRGRRAKSDRLLARLGILRCATCEARMIVGTQNRPGGVRYSFYRCPPTGDCPRRVTIAAEVAERVVSEAARSYLEGTVGVRQTGDNIQAVRAEANRAQDALDAGLRTLADFADEPAAVERLRELREARDRTRERVAELGEPDDATILLLDRDWSDLTPEDQRRCIRATIDRVLVHPAPRGTPPEERLEVVHHDGAAMLTGKTPRIPANVS